jgi:seryl-tRNA synthetase
MNEVNNGAQSLSKEEIMGVRRKLGTQGKEVKAALQEQEKLLDEAEKGMLLLGAKLPNSMSPFTPIDSPVERYATLDQTPTVARPKSPLDHIQLFQNLDLVDFTSAANVSGESFYYLKNEAALLELALTQYTMLTCAAHGYTPLITPDVVRKDVMYACGFQPRDQGEVSQTYFLSEHDSALHPGQKPASTMCLAGTAEIPLGGLYMNKIIERDSLPVRMVGFGHAFRAEAGSRGKESKGLYRVHQFSKVELFVITEKCKSDETFEELVQLQRRLFSGLELHFRFELNRLSVAELIFLLENLKCPQMNSAPVLIARLTLRHGCPDAGSGERSRVRQTAPTTNRGA